MTPRPRYALMLCVLVFSCSSGTGPTSGILNVQLSSLRGDDGAVLFTITGGPVESVEAVSGTVRSAQINANTLRVVVTGNLSYSIAVNQVAARSTYVARDPGQYSVTLAQ
jgi:hypothetical protein